MFEFIAGCLLGFIAATVAIVVGMILKERQWKP
jgi:high-affinity Fe2+/Pb2+ permease